MKKFISIVMTLVMLVSYSLAVDSHALCVTFGRSKPSLRRVMLFTPKKAYFTPKVTQPRTVDI